MLRVIILSLLFFTSCVSTYTSLQNIQPGLSKQDVRYILGKPIFIGRLNGFDLWTYKVKRYSQEYTNDIFFDEGLLIKIGDLIPYPNYKKKMINAESLEEYEINAAFYQKQRQNGFREINSVKTNSFCSYRFKGSTQLNCNSIIKNKKFIPQALKFCDTKINTSYNKLKCLKTISNTKFNKSALNFCKTKINTSYNKLKCLKTISNKKFSKSALMFCTTNNKLDNIKLKCLNNLGHTLI